jgi:tetratricopeptide (TPR) repeat protein
MNAVARLSMLGLLIAALATLPAHADEASVAAADALFRDGRALMKSRDYKAACDKFQRSQYLDPAAGTAINLGDCFRELGKLAGSLQAYHTALSLLAVNDPRAKEVMKQVSDVEERVPHLKITLAAASPEGTTVTRDGRKVDVAELGTRVAVNPGKHVIVVTAPKHKAARSEITLKQGQSLDLELEVGGESLNMDQAGETGAALSATTDGAEAEPSTVSAHREPPRYFVALASGVMLPFGDLVKNSQLADSVNYVVPIELSFGLWLSRRFALGLQGHYGVLGMGDGPCTTPVPAKAPLATPCTVSGRHLRAGLWGELHLSETHGPGAMPWLGAGLASEVLRMTASPRDGKPSNSTFYGVPEFNARFGIDLMIASWLRAGPFIGGSIASYSAPDNTQAAPHEWLWIGIRGAHDI